jgi:hypothetical protein
MMTIAAAHEGDYGRSDSVTIMMKEDKLMIDSRRLPGWQRTPAQSEMRSARRGQPLKVTRAKSRPSKSSPCRPCPDLILY